jgi:putative GTP pyrophosphokinase
MSDPKRRADPKADVESILVEFDAKEDVLAAFCARTKSLIEASLQDANIRYQSVQTRVKTRKKLREKYLDPAKNYQRLDDITDLAGLRIITYYEDEIESVAAVIKREFELDTENSVDKRETEPDRFGYSALNYVCGHSEKRKSDVEFKKFAHVRCEIQITSILRHAWSEIEHEWYDLKCDFPDNIKRRLARMAALLEIAEEEFLNLRKLQSNYQQAVAIQVETKVPDVPVDTVSLKAFIFQDPLVSEVDASIALALGATVLPDVADSVIEKRSTGAKLVGMRKLQDVRESLQKHRTTIPEFMRLCNGRVWPAPVRGFFISRGLSVFSLGLLLVTRRREEEMIIEYMRTFDRDGAWDIGNLMIVGEDIAKWEKAQQ